MKNRMTLESFGTWLRSQPADMLYVHAKETRISRLCPIARFTGKSACEDWAGFDDYTRAPIWAARFIHYFDRTLIKNQPAALAALAYAESFEPKPAQRPTQALVADLMRKIEQPLPAGKSAEYVA